MRSLSLGSKLWTERIEVRLIYQQNYATWRFVFFQNPDQGNHATKRLRWKLYTYSPTEWYTTKFVQKPEHLSQKGPGLPKKRPLKTWIAQKYTPAAVFFSPIKNRRFFVGSSFFFPLGSRFFPWVGTISWIRSKTWTMGVAAIKQQRWLGNFCFLFFFWCQKKGRTYIFEVGWFSLEGFFVSFSFGGERGRGVFFLFKRGDLFFWKKRIDEVYVDQSAWWILTLNALIATGNFGAWSYYSRYDLCWGLNPHCFPMVGINSSTSFRRGFVYLL